MPKCRAASHPATIHLRVKVTQIELAAYLFTCPKVNPSISAIFFSLRFLVGLINKPKTDLYLFEDGLKPTTGHQLKPPAADADACIYLPNFYAHLIYYLCTYGCINRYIYIYLSLLCIPEAFGTDKRL